MWMHSTPKSFDSFLDEIRECVLARRCMKQDIIQLRSGCQRWEVSGIAALSEEHSDTDMWSSTQSTTTMGLMTPTEHESDGDDGLVMGYNEDSALEDVLGVAKGEFTQKNLARLVFHWTNTKVFGEFERHELTNSF
jgi:hypothetical protein